MAALTEQVAKNVNADTFEAFEMQTKEALSALSIERHGKAQKPAANERRSELFDPAVKINPETAAKGAEEMMASRHASSAPSPSTIKPANPPQRAAAHPRKEAVGSSSGKVEYTLEQMILQDPALTNEQRMRKSVSKPAPYFPRDADKTNRFRHLSKL